MCGTKHEFLAVFLLYVFNNCAMNARNIYKLIEIASSSEDKQKYDKLLRCVKAWFAKVLTIPNLHI